MSGKQKVRLVENTKTIMNMLLENYSFRNSNDYLEVDNDEKTLIDIQIKTLELLKTIMINRCWKNHILGVKMKLSDNKNKISQIKISSNDKSICKGIFIRLYMENLIPRTTYEEYKNKIKSIKIYIKVSNRLDKGDKNGR